MNRVRILVEGQTEQNFVRDILKPYFDSKNIFLHAVMFNPTGGIVGYQKKAKKVIVSSLKKDPGLYYTTMIDYYGMPKDWPGREESKSCKNYKDKSQTIEKALLDDVVAQMSDGWNPDKFIPYVQMHAPAAPEAALAMS